MRLNKPQLRKLHQKWTLSDQGMSFLSFRRSVGGLIGCPGVAMVLWCNMWLGIEPNGEAHS